MLRTRLMRPRWVVYLVIAWGMVLAAMPSPGVAAPVPPLGDGREGADLQTVREVLEQKIIQERLSALGASPAEVQAVLARLSPEERSELATRAHELAAGGNGLVVLGLAAIVAALVILILELMGRRVISRG